MAKTDKRTAKAEFSVKLEVLKQLKTKTGLYIPNADKEVKMGGQHGDGIGIIFSKIKPQPKGANGTAANPYHYSIAATDNAPDWARAAIKGAKPGIRNSFKPALRCALANTLLPSGFTVRAAADGKYQLRENGKTLSVHKQISGAIESAFQAADEMNSSNNQKAAHAARAVDVQTRQQVEQSAIDKVKKHYCVRGFCVYSVEKDNCGWDLVANNKSGAKFLVEVKGHRGNSINCDLTPNEYAAAKKNQNYRLAVVTDALNEKRLHIFAFDKSAGNWRCEYGGNFVVKNEERTGARIRHEL